MDYVFLLLYVLVPAVMLAVLPSVGVSLRKFSIPSLFIIYYLMFAYLGHPILYFGKYPLAVSLGLTDKEELFKLYLYSSVALISICAGFVYAYRVLEFRVTTAQPYRVVGATKMQRRLMIILFIICILVFLRYISQLGNLALFEVLDGNIAQAALARSNMGNSFTGKYWRYQLFFRYLLDYCAIFFFSDFLVKRSSRSFILAAISFFSATFTAIVAIEKAPFAGLLIILYLAYAINKGGNYWQSAAKYVAIALISSLSFFYTLSMGASTGVQSSLVSIFHRVLTGQIVPAYFYLDIFPKKIDFLWGASFPNPGGLLPFTNYPLTMVVSNVMFPINAVRGVVGTAPTAFWGEMYVNFGAVGVPISAFFVGIGVFFVAHLLSRWPLSPVTIAAMISLGMNYATLSMTSLSSYLVDTTMLAIALVTVIVLLLGNKRFVMHRSLPQASFSGKYRHAE